MSWELGCHDMCKIMASLAIHLSYKAIPILLTIFWLSPSTFCDWHPGTQKFQVIHRHSDGYKVRHDCCRQHDVKWPNWSCTSLWHVKCQKIFRIKTMGNIWILGVFIDNYDVWVLLMINLNQIWWLCLVPTSTTRFASEAGYRMAKV